MKFSTRLYAGFAVVLAATIALGSFAIVQVGSIAGHTHAIATNWMPSVQTLGAIKAEMREFRTQELQHILSTEAAEMDRFEADMAKAIATIEAKFAEYEKLISSDEERTLFAELKRVQAERIAGHMKLRAVSRENRTAEAIALARGEIATLRSTTARKLEELIAINARGATDQLDRAERDMAFTGTAIPIALLVAVTAALGVAVPLVRATLRQLGGEPADALAAVDRIAAGDLATPVTVKSGDTTSVMAGMARMREQLAGLVRGVVEGSVEIRTAAQEVARGNLDLSSRTEQQSASLQETAAALEEMTGSIASTADGARGADRFARDATDVARRAGDAVGEVVRTMASISESSNRMRDIIGVIDGIAFQTNILALNAAVEAARAGEQGRGFAVVASEVRTLARRSADAAREIKGLIEESSNRVDDGARRAGDAGETMTGVVASVEQVSALIAGISSAANEQSGSVGQINTAVAQLDSVTQQNAALVEEAAAATKSLEQQAEALVRAASVFRVA